MEEMIVILHGAFLLIFGVFLSGSFVDLHLDRKNILTLFWVCLLLGLLQTITLILWGEDITWLVYPWITHLPLVVFLHMYYHKKWSTSIVAVASTYLCCQPSKWFGIISSYLGASLVNEYIIRWSVLFFVAIIIVNYLTPYLSQIYLREDRSVILLGSVPLTYYIFDYSVGIYTDLWLSNNPIVAEFLPFFLCVSFLVFAMVYYKENEEKMDAKRKEKIIHLSIEQQSKEMEVMKHKEYKTRLLRHDMRVFLSDLYLSIEKGQKDEALRMIRNYMDSVESTVIPKYINDPMVDHVIASYAERCECEGIDFVSIIEVDTIEVDEVILCSILSGVLENAVVDQLSCPTDMRSIKLVMRKQCDQLLVSISEPLLEIPMFIDGMPIDKNDRHSTQEIRHLVERLGGTCEFSMKDQMYIFRALI
ncbi:MAG: sensor histidine kinase [Erysipelotrichaceae bacterium]|nr:sensor histidine kinase [Erysipelotrichaceae bacterium]